MEDPLYACLHKQCVPVAEWGPPGCLCSFLLHCFPVLKFFQAGLGYMEDN